MNDPTIRDRIRSRFPAPTKGQDVFYKFIPAADVPKARRRDARRYADGAAAKLGIPPVAIRWMDTVAIRTPPAPGMWPGGTWQSQAVPPGMAPGPMPEVEPLYDLFDRCPRDGELAMAVTGPSMPNTIGLHRDLRGRLLEALIAHEIRHVWQQRDGNIDDAQRFYDEREADAQRFAAAYVRAA